MYTIAPLSRSGSCLFSNAALMADRISALERPAITILLRRKAIGNIERAAWGFRQSAPLTFGFQNSGQSNAAIQALSTLQTNPFLPSTAVSYPCRPRTRIVASWDIESGAALRANWISSFFSIRYWSTGTIFGYLSDCAAAFGTENQMLSTSTMPMTPIIRSLILSLLFALVARHPVAGAAHSPSSIHSYRRGPNLENAAVLQRRMLGHELYSMIHIPCLKDEYA